MPSIDRTHIGYKNPLMLEPISGKKGYPNSSFPLSIRTTNCLRSIDIDYVGQLLFCTEKELLQIPHFGMGCLKEVKDLLVEKGLSLGLTPQIELNSPAELRDFYCVPLTIDKHHPAYRNPAVLRKVSSLPLTVRLRNAMMAEQIEYVGQLIIRRPQEISKIPSIGDVSLNGIKNILKKECGLELGVNCPQVLRTYEDIESFFAVNGHTPFVSAEDELYFIDVLLPETDISEKSYNQVFKAIQGKCQQMFNAEAARISMVLMLPFVEAVTEGCKITDYNPVRSQPQPTGSMATDVVYPKGKLKQISVPVSDPSNANVAFTASVLKIAATNLSGMILYSPLNKELNAPTYGEPK